MKYRDLTKKQKHEMLIKYYSFFSEKEKEVLNYCEQTHYKTQKSYEKQKLLQIYAKMMFCENFMKNQK